MKPPKDAWRHRVFRLARENPLVAGGAAIAFLILLVALIGPLLLRNPSDTNAGPPFAPPTMALPMGTDRFGRDLLSRVVTGARWSLFIATVPVLIAAIVGSTLGLIAGYRGGWFDRVLLRVLDLFLGLPLLILAIAIAGGLGPGLRTTMIALTVGFIPAYTLIVRTATRGERERDYVTAATASGTTTPKVITRHLLPNVLPVIIVQGSISLSYAILAESALGFLGLGLQPPIPSWGQMLSEGRPYLLNAPWVSVFPGLAIFVCVFAFNILGDGLRDHLDPRSRHVSEVASGAPTPPGAAAIEEHGLKPGYSSSDQHATS